LPESRSDGRKLASYEVAGIAPKKFNRPEGTPDSAVPPGRNHFGTANPAQCAGLISGVAPRQFRSAAFTPLQLPIAKHRTEINWFADVKAG
jgi:hypothetical protein